MNDGLLPTDEVFLVDASGFIFRAFFSAEKQDEPYRYNDRGEPIGGVKLFTERLFAMRRWGVHNRYATHMAMVFDGPGGSTARKALYPAYKTNRPEKPDDLKRQMPLMREAARALGIAIVDEPGVEADDVIATYAHTAAEQGASVLIVSSDKDLMQLIQPGVMMFSPEMGTPGFPGHKAALYVGHDEVVAKFGVPPEKVIEVQALAGDPGDGIPGIPKVGLKTAAALIQEHGDIEAVLAAAPAMKPCKLRDRLIEHANLARISRQLVKLDCLVDYSTGLEEMLLDEVDRERVIAFARAVGMPSIVRKMEEDREHQARRAA
jgi:DNA polymerase-1